MKIQGKKGITLIALVITIIILLILTGIAVATLGGENGLLSKVKIARSKYEVADAKETLELAIMNLRIDEEGKGETLTKEDLPKINNDEIDVGNTENFPVEVICKMHRFNVDENFIVTYIGEATGTTVTYTTDPVGYTNQDEIHILIKVSNPKGIKLIEYPDGDKIISTENKTEVGIDYKVTANGTYTFKVIDNEDKEVIKDVVIDQIDKLPPLDFTPEITKGERKITVIANAQDAEPDETSTKSGISYYEYYLIDESGKEKKYETNEIENLALGTYRIYVIAYDKVGNSTKSNQVSVSLTRTFVKMSAGDGHSLAIDNEGKLWAWGSNSNGQLGDGTKTNRTIPIQIKTETKFAQISSGQYHNLAIDRDGNLWAWGSNSNGQLGDGTKTNRTIPIQIKTETKFAQISSGQYHNLAIDRDGNLWAWGSNSNGQLGDGTNIDKFCPVQITEGTQFTQISGGFVHSLAIDSENNLWAWGNNGYGQLLDGTTTNRTTPTQINVETKFTQISTGRSYSLLIDTEENLWACGDNKNGQLGDGTTTDRTTPIQIKTEIKFKEISTCFIHNLAIDSEGNLWAWGYNSNYQLGDGTKTNRTSPVQIKSGTKFTQISAGYDHSLGIDSEGNSWAWGNNYNGQLGNETIGTQSSKPKQIMIK